MYDSSMSCVVNFEIGKAKILVFKELGKSKLERLLNAMIDISKTNDFVTSLDNQCRVQCILTKKTWYCIEGLDR